VLLDLKVFQELLLCKVVQEQRVLRGRLVQPVPGQQVLLAKLDNHLSLMQ
jgi:hypothetical protein